MNEDHDDCLQLRKTIYDLVQNVREFYKKLILVLNLSVLWKIIQVRACCLIGTEKNSFSVAFMLMTVLSLGKNSGFNG
jgi:hypothetical protein